MKYVYIVSFGIIFTALVGAIQALINPQNWSSLQDINLSTWIGIGVGFAILTGFALYCLKQVRKIDEKDKEAQRQELKEEVREIFKEAGLLKSPKNKEDK